MTAETTQERATVEVADEVLDRAEIANGRAVVSYSRTEAALALLAEKYAGKTYDLTTTAGDKEARAARLEMVTLRTGLEAKRREFKAPAIAFGKLIDAEAERITGEIRKLEEPIDAQIKADEARREAEREAKRNAEAARIAGYEAGIADIRAFVTRCANEPSSRIAAAMDVLDRIATTEAEFAEFAMTAARAKAETLGKLGELHEAAAAREAEAARLAAERAAQRIEAERLAAERATLAAQQAEMRRQQEEIQRQQREIAEAAAREEARRAAERKTQEEAEALHAAQKAERDAQALKALEAQPILEVLEERQPYRPSDWVEPDAPAAAPAPATQPPTLKLGEINTRLGFTLTADFLASLGFTAAVERNARLFNESDWDAIKAALVAHIQKA